MICRSILNVIFALILGIEYERSFILEKRSILFGNGHVSLNFVSVAANYPRP